MTQMVTNFGTDVPVNGYSDAQVDQFAGFMALSGSINKSMRLLGATHYVNNGDMKFTHYFDDVGEIAMISPTGVLLFDPPRVWDEKVFIQKAGLHKKELKPIE